MVVVLNSVDSLGRWILTQVRSFLELHEMFYLSLRATAQDRGQGLRAVMQVLSAQIYFTGIQALPLIGILGVATGGVVVLNSSQNLHLFGGAQWLGQLLVLILVRELGPLITALVVIARSGTAVASELGNMRANREIEALEVMGINPLSYIVFPRIVGGVVSTICLSFYFLLVSVFGGMLITKFAHDIPLTFVIDSFLSSLSSSEAFLFLVKTSFSGAAIFLICCREGLSVSKGPTEVPVVTTRAVVRSIFYVVIFNLTVTAVFYVSQQGVL